jgi:hypothetical protein
MLLWISLPQPSPAFKLVVLESEYRLRLNKSASDYLLIATFLYDPDFNMLPEEMHYHMN